MKTTFKFIHAICIILLLSTITLKAQVGIGTTNPAQGSMLDIDSSDKGILIPRVALTATTDVTTITPAASLGLLVFNTATAGAGTTAVSEGFYYWNGSLWVRIQDTDFDWKIDGNNNITNGVHFLGTLNNRNVDFRTNNTDRFRIPGNHNQVHAMANGSRIRPFYSWDDDTSMGFWKSGSGQMSLSIDGTDFFTANANTPVRELSFNPTSDVMHFRVESDNEPNTFFINGATDNIGLGTNTPHLSAELEMTHQSRGLLINRVALTSRNLAAPLTTPATGVLVYNTNTAGTAPFNVTPGFYFWNSSEWVALDGTGGRDWSLLGNSGTNPTVNFLGTTDAADLRFRTNNTERMRIAATGNLGVNHNSFNNVGLTLDTGGNDVGILAIASGGNPVTGAGIAIFGQGEDNSGVRGNSTNYHGVYGRTDYTGTTGLVAATLGLAAGNSLSTGVVGAAVFSGSPNTNIGIRAMAGSGTSITPNGYNTIGITANATDLGFYALTERPINNNTSISTEAAQFKSNFTGDALGADARDPQARLAGYEPSVSISGQGTHNTYYGGYFYSGGHNTSSSFAYAGARRGTTNFKIIGNGTVSTIVSGASPDSPKKVMFAPEAPEVLFQDYGTGQLVNGVAHIQIDPIFARNIHVSNEKPLKVFIQLEGDCKGVFVTNKSANGFTVQELQGGTSNAPFSWHIVANRADEIINGERTVYQSLRFPDAPERINDTSANAQNLKEERIEEPKFSSTHK